MKFRVEIETDDEPTAERIRAIVDVIPAATLTAFDPARNDREGEHE